MLVFPIPLFAIEVVTPATVVLSLRVLEPENDVAVTTPTTSIPPASTFIPALAVTIPKESILVTSS